MNEGMAQDPSEPVVEQVAFPDSSDPQALWNAFAPPLRAFLARRVPAGRHRAELATDGEEMGADDDDRADRSHMKPLGAL